MPPKPSDRASLIARMALLGVLGITAIALLSSRYGWPIYLELLCHFQRQYWALTVLGVGAIGLTRRPWPIFIGLACVAALTTQLLPWYWPPHWLSAPPAGNFRILIVNVNIQNRNYAATLTLAQQVQPDLALFMEVDDRWIDQLHPLTATLPHVAGPANTDHSGSIFYSRQPLANVELMNFSPDSDRTITANLTVNGRTLALVGTHPLPPVPPTAFRSRNRQLEALGQYLQTVDRPKLVIGDLNITMWSPYYRRLLRQTGLKNARDGFGLLPSWPVGQPYAPLPAWVAPLFAIPIDHGLLSPELTVADIQIGPDVGSDHRPVIIDLRL